jgi:hypothetical protein
VALLELPAAFLRQLFCGERALEQHLGCCGCKVDQRDLLLLLLITVHC